MGRAGGVLAVLAALCSAGLCLCGLNGVCMAAAAWAVFAWYYRMAKKEFGGITGDLAGWFLATAELAMAAVWCLC